MREEVETMRSYPNFKRMFYSRENDTNRGTFRGEYGIKKKFLVLQKR